MKRVFCVMLALMCAAALLAGCGQSQKAQSSDAPLSVEAPDLSALKTVGDIENMENADILQSAAYEDAYILVFTVGATPYRAFAAMTPEVFEAVMNLDYADEGWAEREKELLRPLEILRIENLDEQIPPQEELDRLKGKTGQELLDEGWTFSGCNLETMEYWLDYGLFEYVVVFEGEAEITDGTDGEELMKKLTVKSVSYSGIGDATNPA